MADRKIRVRFAPSPTGYLHIGSARTALFNWLFARAKGGDFILRIEDTDRSRYVEDSMRDIVESLSWLGIDWDEGPEKGGEFGPYFQSERLDIYNRHIRILLESGKAYYCFCTEERLEKLREEQQRRKEPPGYDRHCRSLSDEDVKRLIGEGRKPVIRFKSPLSGTTSFVDGLRGEISFENSTLDDFVLMKSDDYPTYHFANVVDDHHMRITHVLRGEEWIPSTPRHILLYAAFGWEPPIIAHLPVILSPTGGKLSKRHGATTVREFREKGYIIEALINFLSLLGWTSDGENEFFEVEELKRLFSLERVSKSPAIFSYDKLNWFNGIYIRKLEVKDLANRCLPYLENAGLISSPITDEEYRYLIEVIPLIQERLRILSEVKELTDFFFKDDIEYTDIEDMIPKKMELTGTIDVLEVSLKLLEDVEDYSVENLERELRVLTEELGLKAGQVFMPIRVAVSGKTATPGLFETLSVLGKSRVVPRLKKGLAALKEFGRP